MALESLHRRVFRQQICFLKLKVTLRIIRGWLSIETYLESLVADMIETIYLEAPLARSSVAAAQSPFCKALIQPPLVSNKVSGDRNGCAILQVVARGRHNQVWLMARSILDNTLRTPLRYEFSKSPIYPCMFSRMRL